MLRVPHKSPEPAEDTKSFYWRNHGMVVLQIDDPNLTWDQREIVRQIMTRRYGERRQAVADNRKSNM